MLLTIDSKGKKLAIIAHFDNQKLSLIYIYFNTLHVTLRMLYHVKSTTHGIKQPYHLPLPHPSESLYSRFAIKIQQSKSKTRFDFLCNIMSSSCRDIMTSLLGYYLSILLNPVEVWGRIQVWGAQVLSPQVSVRLQHCG